jgi:hypothetical protein
LKHFAFLQPLPTRLQPPLQASWLLLLLKLLSIPVEQHQALLLMLLPLLMVAVLWQQQLCL